MQSSGTAQDLRREKGFSAASVRQRQRATRQVRTRELVGVGTNTVGGRACRLGQHAADERSSLLPQETHPDALPSYRLTPATPAFQRPFHSPANLRASGRASSSALTASSTSCAACCRSGGKGGGVGDGALLFPVGGYERARVSRRLLVSEEGGRETDRSAQTRPSRPAGRAARARTGRRPSEAGRQGEGCASVRTALVRQQESRTDRVRRLDLPAVDDVLVLGPAL